MQVQSIFLPAQYTPGIYLPAVDLTGATVANLVDGEEQTFGPNQDTAQTFIMPSFAPFFLQGLEVRIKDGSGVFQLATLGVDYTLVYPFLGASRALQLPVFAGIRFGGIAATTTVRLKYQTLGGLWVTGQSRNAAAMLGEIRHPGAVALEQIANYAAAFPAVGAAWDRQDPTSMTGVTAEVDALIAKIQARQAARNYSSQLNHLTRQDNPHGLNKAEVGLGLVSDYPPATTTSSQNPDNDAEYISTAQVNSMMQSWVVPASVSRQGVAKLNLGINPGDDSDTSNALTAAGFTNISANTDSAISRAYNKGQLSRTVSPFPFAYPMVWHGVQYNDRAAFVAAVEALVGVSPLEYNELNGTFWFPANTQLPDLTISAA